MENGPTFLKQRFNLHTSPEVNRAADLTLKRTKEKVPQSPEKRIQNYLDRFQSIIDKGDNINIGHGAKLLKGYFYKSYIIPEDQIPESYFELQQRIAREQGHGDIEITHEKRTEAVRVIQEDQKESLSQWIDYLASSDAVYYPDWAKYWAVRSMLAMGPYDKKKHSFSKRTKSTTAPFPDLNREAFAYVIDVIVKRVKKEKVKNPVETGQNEHANEEKAVSDEDFAKILSTENFAKYYAFAIEHVVADHSELFKITEGEWVKFDKDTPGMELSSTLQGHGTGWCTAGESTADAQLGTGDFYVYYSKNELGEAKIPRLAIRMHYDHIAEVRGVAHQQEIDPYISPVLEEKMDEFGDEGEAYKKKSENMRMLTQIDNKVKDGEEPTIEDLRFLYQANGKVEGFGYGEDPRILEILGDRDAKKDLADIFTDGDVSKVGILGEDELKEGMEVLCMLVPISDISPDTIPNTATHIMDLYKTDAASIFDEDAVYGDRGARKLLEFGYGGFVIESLEHEKLKLISYATLNKMVEFDFGRNSIYPTMTGERDRFIRSYPYSFANLPESLAIELLDTNIDDIDKNVISLTEKAGYFKFHRDGMLFEPLSMDFIKAYMESRNNIYDASYQILTHLNIFSASVSHDDIALMILNNEGAIHLIEHLDKLTQTSVSMDDIVLSVLNNGDEESKKDLIFLNTDLNLNNVHINKYAKEVQEVSAKNVTILSWLKKWLK